MKNRSANNLFITLFAALALILSSCVRNNVDSASQNGGNGGLNGAVPSDFNWATVKTTNLTVVPDDSYAGNYYLIEVFGGNPLFGDSALLLAKGVAKGGSSYITDMVIPTSTTELFVRQTSPLKKQIVQMIAVTGANLVCDFGVTASPTASAMPAVPTLRSSKIVAPEVTPANPVVLTSASSDVSWTDNVNYLIPSGQTYTGSIALGNNSCLYIEGTYSLSDKKKSFAIASNGKLVVQSTGKLQTTSDVALSFHIGQIKNYGTITAHGDFTLTSKSTMYNAGTITFDNFASMNADNTIVNDGVINAIDYSVQSYPFTNNGSFSGTGIFEVTSTASFVNNGTVNVAELDTKSGSKIFNNCHIVVKELLDLHGTTYNGFNGSLIKAELMVADGTNFLMAEASIIDVNSAQFSTWRNYINGVGATYALARFGEVTSYKKAVSKNITYQGKVEVECSNHLSNDKNNPFWVVEGSNVRWAKEGASTTVIPSTGCNDGGNNSSNGGGGGNPGTPVDPQFPILVKLTTNYSFIMEDNWPWFGDYDLNDLVVDLNISYLQNADNKATEMTVAFNLRAAGASKKIAGAFQLDKLVPSQIYSVSYKKSTFKGTIFATEKGGLETGQSKAVIPLFDDAHLLLNPTTAAPTMINTLISSPYYQPVSDTIRIVFTNPVSPSDLTISNLNFFIATNLTAPSNQRTEVHLSGFEPTDKANRALFGTADDYSLNGARYRTSDNLIWGLLIPTSFKYAAEWQNIKTVYPKFEGWCTSGGVENTFWYEEPTAEAGKVYKK